MIRDPRVFIVGAGPGDPTLISVKGHRLLEQADVVIYDREVSPRVLALAGPQTEKIEAGSVAPRPVDQDAISMLVAEKAREGRMVVRLKWGDAFVFDSGGKEALFLHEQRIPFAVVPGIPAAIGAPAYSGIPVTYPGAGDVLVVIRGYDGTTDTMPQVDWARLAGLDGTIVCFAAASQIARITGELLVHGRSPSESAALVYRGTTTGQQTIVAALTEIAGHAEPDQPAMLVIGAVVGLRDHLRWFDDRPLFGRRIVVIRARDQAGELVDLLEARGAEAIVAPTIRIAPPADVEPMESACRDLDSYDGVVLTSANAVDAFAQQVLAFSDLRDLQGIRLCVVGAGTAARLWRHGLRPDVVPEEYRAEALVATLKEQEPVAGLHFLLPHSDIGREVIADELREAGATVTEVVAYRTMAAAAERDGEQDIYRMLLDRQIDAITFTSASSVRNFASIFGEDQAADLLRTTVVACIGPVTADAARQLNIATTVMPERYTVADMVDALVTHFTAGARLSVG